MHEIFRRLGCPRFLLTGAMDDGGEQKCQGGLPD